MAQLYYFVTTAALERFHLTDADVGVFTAVLLAIGLTGVLGLHWRVPRPERAVPE
jgi:hypothetical protein